MLLTYLLLLVLGAVFGSFISAYSYRWPRGISISTGRSFCPNCKAKISWYDNIPLLSYLVLGGKCRKCKKRISARYPLIELSTGILFVLTIFSMGGFGVLEFLPATYYLLLTAILITILVIDLENKLIPDELTFLIFSISFLFLLLSPAPNFYSVLFAGFLAATFFLFLNIITRGRGMGLGDVKLVLALSLSFLNWQFLVLWLFLSFAIGAVIGIFLIIIGKAKFGKEIPFGPFLIASFFITLFWGDFLVKFLFPYLF